MKYIRTTSQKELLALHIRYTTPRTRADQRERTISQPSKKEVSCASVPFPSIHQIAHVHSYTDCAGLVKRSSQQQTSKRAGESIAQEKERTRVRNARASRQVATYPAPKKAHSLARSLAHLRLAASAHTIRSSRHQHHPFLAWRADDERAIGPTTQPPCPRSGSLLSALTSPRAPLSIHETSARARVRAAEQRRRVRPSQFLASIPAHDRPHFPAASAGCRYPRERMHACGTLADAVITLPCVVQAGRNRHPLFLLPLQLGVRRVRKSDPGRAIHLQPRGASRDDGG